MHTERGRTDGPVPEVGTGEAAGAMRWVWFGLVALAALALDLASKRFIQGLLEVGEHRHILGAFRLQYEVNDGIAFGLLSGRQSLIIPAASLAFLAIIAYVFLDRRRVAAVAGGLMAGGSLGNLLERFAYGHVTDFFHTPFWPTFNVADTFIVVGVLLVGVILLFDLRGPSTGR